MNEHLLLFSIFAQIGMFTIGGGMAMLPLVQQALISRSLMSMNEAVDMVAISQMTPGPFAVNCATFCGMKLYGVTGAAVATLGVALPSFIICLLVSRWFFKYNSSPAIRSILSGIKPVVLSLILSSLISFGRTAIFPSGSATALDIPVLCIAAVMTVLILKTKFSPALLVIACGLFGALFLK